MNFLKRNAGILLILYLLILFIFPEPLFAQTASKRVYIANDDHTDYMWTADEATYRQAFLEMLDYYLNLADTTASEQPQFQSRFNADGTLWMWTYEKNRTASEFQRLINRIKDGHITVPLNAIVTLVGGQPAEAVLRGMYYPGLIERRFNLRFPLVMSMENQTLPFGVGALWAGAGAKYSWKGVCGCASHVSSISGTRPHEIYWWQGLDGSRLLTKWYSLEGNESLGGYAEARSPSTAVDRLDAKLGTSNYPFQVGGAFGKGWDDLKTLTNEFVTVAKNRNTSARSVTVSNELDFFQDFETNYGATLPTYGASFGNEWELYTASMQEVTSRVRRTIENLRSAEGLATLVSLVNPGFMNGRETARDLAFMDVGLFWDHDWTADGPISKTARANWQKRLATEIETYGNTLFADAKTALGGLIQKSGTNTRFYTFNPLSWARTDVADFPFTSTGLVHVVDLSSGQEVPSQLVTIGGQQYLRILAENVPSVGYKVFEVRSGSGQTFPSAAATTTNSLENNLYKIILADRGAITSLIDKQNANREFAQVVSGRAINDLGTGTGTLQVVNSGPVSVTLRATSSSPLAHTSDITLFRTVPRIDIRNEITQNFGSTNTWGFGYNLTSPDVRHEEVGAIIRAKLLAQGGQYAPTHARYDWLTLNHFADMSSGAVGITLSNADTSFMKLGSSTNTALDTTMPLISPLAGGQVDGTGLGIQNQGGDTRFLQRFALQPHLAFDQTIAMKFSLEHQNPLVTGAITGGSAYPANNYSLLSISDPNVLLWALKPAEEGIAQGMIARTWNVAETAKNYTLNFSNRSITSAKNTSHIETDLSDATLASGALTTSANRQQMKSYRLFTTGSTNPSPSPSPTLSPSPSPTSSPTPVPGDVNQDGIVNGADIKVFLQSWLSPTCTLFACDFNSDSKINSLDAAVSLRDFGL